MSKATDAYLNSKLLLQGDLLFIFPEFGWSTVSVPFYTSSALTYLTVMGNTFLRRTVYVESLTPKYIPEPY